MPFLAFPVIRGYTRVRSAVGNVAHGKSVDVSSSLWGAVQGGRDANGFRAAVSGSASVIETYADYSTRLPNPLHD